jgi:oligopeptidase B
MKGRIKEKDESVPVYSNGYWYYTRSEEGQQYFKYCRKKGTLEASEEILLDVDKMAEGHPYYSAAVSISVLITNCLAYGVDTVSRRQYTIYIQKPGNGRKFQGRDLSLPAADRSGVMIIRRCFIRLPILKLC